MIMKNYSSNIEAQFDKQYALRVKGTRTTQAKHNRLCKLARLYATTLTGESYGGRKYATQANR
jgi:hypothetical protein